MKHFYHPLFFVFFPFLMMAQSPGAVKNHKIWFEAHRDAGLFVEKDSTTTSATIAADSTDFYSAMNFHSGLTINGANEKLVLPIEIEEAPQTTIYTVYLADDEKSALNIWSIKGLSLNMVLNTGSVSTFDEKATYADGEAATPIINTYTKFWKQNNTLPDSLFTNPSVTIAGPVNDSLLKPFKGRIAEFIFYDRVLKALDSDKIETYLAVKYGISLKNRDYLSSSKKKLWDNEENNQFGHRIAAIGRDSTSQLYQKQSNNTEVPNTLIIGLDSIALSNKQNNGTLNDEHFLVWGDNNDTLAIESNEDMTGRIPLLKRKWMMQATGEKIGETTTMVKLYAPYFFQGELLPKEEYILVIDSKGDNTYLAKNTSYVSPESISENGMLVFKDILWDTDKSGKDGFTFTTRTAIGAQLIASDEIDCERADSGKLTYHVFGGVPPYNYTLKSKELDYTNQWDSNNEKEDYRLEELSQGNYELMVTDSFDELAQSTVFVESPEPLIIDLGNDKRIIENQPVHLDASEKINDDSVNYEWTSDNGFYNSSSQISVTKPGTYTVTATNNKGCTKKDEIDILPSAMQNFMVFPNSSIHGHYNIVVQLDTPSELTVKIHDINGRLLTAEKKKKDTRFEFDGHIKGASGIYTIVIETLGHKITRKFIKG